MSAKKALSPLSPRDPQEWEAFLKLNMYFKVNKPFSSWKKNFVCLCTDKVFRVYANDAAFATKKKCELQIPCEKLEIREIEKPSKPGAILFSLRKTSTSYLLAPIFENEKLSQIKQHMQQLKERIVEMGGSELEKLNQTKKPTAFASLAPEIQFKSMSNFRSRLEWIPVEKWTEDDVQEWLGYIRNTDGKRMKEAFGEMFAANNIAGDTLVELNDQALRAMGVQSLGKRLKLLKEIKKLQEKKVYDLNEHIVMSKFEGMPPKWRSGMSQKEMEEKVSILCDVDAIKRTYLNVEKYSFLDAAPAESSAESSQAANSSNMDDDIISEDSNVNVDELAEREAKKKLNYEDVLKASVNEGDEITDVATIMNSDQYKENQKKLENEARKKIPIKLVITEILHSSKDKLIRNLLSMTIGGIPQMAPTFGMFHTALVVGPWYLEWTDSSLCIPKKINSSSAILAMDVDTITCAAASLPQIADKLAQLIVEWNVNYSYKNAFKKDKEFNCQDFVEAVLEKLGVQHKFSGAMKAYLDEMRERGCGELIFRPTKQFRETFGLDKEGYKFHTHEELDQFVINLKQQFPTISIDYASEMGLLKAFDRGFWVRHFKNPDKEEYKSMMTIDPITKALKTKCPFRDPRETGTMAGGM